LRLTSARNRALAALGAVLLAAVAQTAEPQSVEVARFSAGMPGGALPPEWRPLVFKRFPRNTEYSLVEDGGRVVLRAEARAAASGLARRLRVDLRRYPVLRWSWKVTTLIAKADIHTKRGDDCPARLYVTFEYDSSKVGWLERAKFEALRLVYREYPPIAALNYIWDGREPQGTFLPNAFTARAEMIVVESGPSRVGQWVEERRDVLADYRQAFGSEPPLVSGVAVMTDTDNTGESAVSYYGDVAFETAR
jgi:hypothetical protein